MIYLNIKNHDLMKEATSKRFTSRLKNKLFMKKFKTIKRIEKLGLQNLREKMMNSFKSLTVEEIRLEKLEHQKIEERLFDRVYNNFEITEIAKHCKPEDFDYGKLKPKIVGKIVKVFGSKKSKGKLRSLPSILEDKRFKRKLKELKKKRVKPFRAKEWRKVRGRVKTMRMSYKEFANKQPFLNV